LSFNISYIATYYKPHKIFRKHYFNTLSDFASFSYISNFAEVDMYLNVKINRARRVVRSMGDNPA